MVPLGLHRRLAGAIHILLVKVQSPTVRASFFCCSPGVAAFIMASMSALLMAGRLFGLSWARAGRAARASRDNATVNRAFMVFPPLIFTTWINGTGGTAPSGDAPGRNAP